MDHDTFLEKVLPEQTSAAHFAPPETTEDTTLLNGNQEHASLLLK
jgi:hypothetical protein